VDPAGKKNDGQVEMKIDADFIKEFAVISNWFEKKPVLCLFWRVLSFLLAILCYLGVICSTVIFELLPFQILKWCKVTPPAPLYWILTIPFSVVICAACGFLAVMIYRLLRIGRISVDLMALFFGSALAAWLAGWIVFRGW
jgi:hypothetical protein